MYKSFNEFYELRNQWGFKVRLDTFCEGLVYTGASFDDWWEDYAVPLILSGNYANGEELTAKLLDEGIGSWMMDKFGKAGDLLGKGLGGGIGYPLQGGWNFLKNAGKLFTNDPYGAGQQPQAPQQQQQPQQPQQPQKPQQPQQAQGDQQVDPRQQKAQGQADQIVNQVKNAFAKHMHDFMTSMQQQAYQSNNPHVWQAVQFFNKKIQGVVDSFKLVGRASDGSGPSYQSDFDQARQPWQRGQQLQAAAQRQANLTPDQIAVMKAQRRHLRKTGQGGDNPEQTADQQAAGQQAAK